jgi:hypothetical protein
MQKKEKGHSVSFSLSLRSLLVLVEAQGPGKIMSFNDNGDQPRASGSVIKPGA